ncbi:unnamed protein product [Prorocentrum cordatum]|uniref:Uncharacterized protein n=1 Tax=Prorocentrum cordatum TaxID=2364126 RepID=A0ABN9YCT9_9DINO|nr:unnamed protein product [Polarella glacialis]
MACGWRVLSAACGAIAAVTCLHSGTFVPGPERDRVESLAAASAAAALSLPVLADEIGECCEQALRRLARLRQGGSWEVPASRGLERHRRLIVMGAQADPKRLEAATEAHHKAVGSISGASGVTSLADVMP